MTIAMVNADSPFAAVAADKFYLFEFRDICTPDEHEVTCGMRRKVEAHPTLPLVWVSAGLGVFSTSDEPRTASQAILKALETHSTSL